MNASVSLSRHFCAEIGLGSRNTAFPAAFACSVSRHLAVEPTSFDLVALNFGDNGAILDERSKNFSMTVDEGEYLRLLQRGLVSSFTLPIKKPGGYQVRIAFRDVASEKVGSANQFVEVPNLKKNRLMISGAVLEGVLMEKVRAAAAGPTEGVGEPSDPIYDTSVRQFRKGTLLRFAYAIYNAKLDAGERKRL